MVYVGIDPSLTKTGYAVVDKNGELEEFGTLASPLRGPELWEYYGKELLDIILPYGKEVKVVMEGLAYHSHRVAVLAELSAVLRYLFHLQKIPLQIIQPSALKKILTGNGNANKIMMKRAVGSIYKLEFEDDHQTDAFALAILGQEGKLENIITLK